MNDEQAHAVRERAIQLTGIQWEHTVVTASPRGPHLLLLALAADVCGSTDSTGAIVQHEIDNTNKSVIVTRFLFGHGEWVDSPDNWVGSPVKLRSQAALVRNSAHGTSGPNVVFLSDGPHVHADMMCIARRFGGFAIDSTGKCVEVTAVGMTGNRGMLPVSAWTMQAEAILQHGAAIHAVAAAAEAMEACGVAMHTDTRDMTMQAIKAQHVNDLHDHVRISVGNMSDAMQDSIQDAICHCILHGIVTGEGTSSIVSTCMAAIDPKFQVDSEDLQDNQFMCVKFKLKLRLAGIVQSLRLMATGCSSDPDTHVHTALSYPKRRRWPVVA